MPCVLTPLITFPEPGTRLPLNVPEAAPQGSPRIDGPLVPGSARQVTGAIHADLLVGSRRLSGDPLIRKEAGVHVSGLVLTPRVDKAHAVVDRQRGVICQLSWA